MENAVSAIVSILLPNCFYDTLLITWDMQYLLLSNTYNAQIVLIVQCMVIQGSSWYYQIATIARLFLLSNAYMNGPKHGKLQYMLLSNSYNSQIVSIVKCTIIQGSSSIVK